MRAEVLRRAAAGMRDEWAEGEAHIKPVAFMRAVADWLDEVAERQAPTTQWGRRSHGWTGAREANAVARAYLGESA